jgi:putative PIN family toxin of toxin-antitoxin system
LRIVLDTNVLVSGVLHAAGPPGRIVDAVLGGDLTLLYDDRLMAEYAEVLARPRFAVPADRLATLLDALAASGEPVTAEPLALRLEDPDDLPFVEVALAGGADALVTGNRRHFTKARRLGVEVVSPADLLGALRSSR